MRCRRDLAVPAPGASPPRGSPPGGRKHKPGAPLQCVPSSRLPSLAAAVQRAAEERGKVTLVAIDAACLALAAEALARAGVYVALNHGQQLLFQPAVLREQPSGEQVRGGRPGSSRQPQGGAPPGEEEQQQPGGDAAQPPPPGAQPAPNHPHGSLAPEAWGVGQQHRLHQAGRRRARRSHEAAVAKVMDAVALDVRQLPARAQQSMQLLQLAYGVPLRPLEYAPPEGGALYVRLAAAQQLPAAQRVAVLRTSQSGEVAAELVQAVNTHGHAEVGGGVRAWARGGERGRGRACSGWPLVCSSACAPRLPQDTPPLIHLRHPTNSSLSPPPLLSTQMVTNIGPCTAIAMRALLLARRMLRHEVDKDFSVVAAYDEPLMLPGRPRRRPPPPPASQQGGQVPRNGASGVAGWSGGGGAAGQQQQGGRGREGSSSSGGGGGGGGGGQGAAYQRYVLRIKFTLLECKIGDMTRMKW